MSNEIKVTNRAIEELDVSSTTVTSVNGKAGAVQLTQDDILDGETYVRFSRSDREKLANIEGISDEDIERLENADTVIRESVKQVESNLGSLPKEFDIKPPYEIFPPTLIEENREGFAYADFVPLEGVTYVVVCDGAEYTCVGKMLPPEFNQFPYIGNLSLVNELGLELPFELEDTGEPFFMSAFMFIIGDGKEQATIAVYAYLRCVAEILPETSINTRIFNFTTNASLKEGDKVRVTIDGKSYYTIMGSQEIEEGDHYEDDGLYIPTGTYLVGNLGLIDDYPYTKIFVNGTNCYFLNDVHYDTPKPRSVEMLKYEEGFENVYDDELDPSSERPVKNKVVAQAIGDISTALDTIIAKQNAVIGGAE